MNQDTHPSLVISVPFLSHPRWQLDLTNGTIVGSIRHLHISSNTPCLSLKHFVYALSSISLGMTIIPRRYLKKNNVIQNLGGQTRCIMGDAQMTNAIFEKQRLHLRTLANLRNRTRVIIISPQLKKLSAKLYIPLNRSFSTRAENINVKCKSWQNTQVITLSRLLHTTEFCRILSSAVLLHKLTITKQTAHSYSW